MENFDIRKFLTENNITEQSKKLDEEKEINEASKFLKGLNTVDDVTEAIRDMMFWMKQNDYMNRHGRKSELYKKLEEAYRAAREYYM